MRPEPGFSAATARPASCVAEPAHPWRYDPARRQGPAIWLRVALGRAIPDLNWEADAPPILYLPGIARETLRAAEDCPQHLRLLVWFMVGGAVFGHANSKDWTLRGFLSSSWPMAVLGWMSRRMTRRATRLLLPRPKLFEMPLSDLQGRRLDAPSLLTLLAPDLADDTLAWLGGGLTAEAEPARFAAFRARAKAELKIDPAKIAPAAAAARVLRRENGWGPVWDRFAKSGRGMYELAAPYIAAVDPPDPLLANPAIYATVNARQETSLRAALAKLKNADEATARMAIVQLAQEHLGRCGGPWAARGQARLAEAVQQLARLAMAPPLLAQDPQSSLTSLPRPGGRPMTPRCARWRQSRPGPEADAIASLQEDRDAVVAALRALYAPRLEREALELQALLPAGPPPSQQPEDFEAILFIDGLRMDVAHRLAGLLNDKGVEVKLNWRWTGFPSVTATCKPLASPAVSVCTALTPPRDLSRWRRTPNAPHTRC